MQAKIVGFCPWIRPESYECYKIGYDTPQEAYAAADRKSKRMAQKKKKDRIYECPVCHQFHLTSARGK